VREKRKRSKEVKGEGGCLGTEKGVNRGRRGQRRGGGGLNEGKEDAWEGVPKLGEGLKGIFGGGGTELFEEESDLRLIGKKTEEPENGGNIPGRNTHEREKGPTTERPRLPIEKQTSKIIPGRK